MLPDKCGRLIQTVRAISFKIVNKCLVRQLLNDQTIFAGTRVRTFSYCSLIERLRD